MPFDIYINTYDFSSWLCILSYAFLVVPISLILILIVQKVPKNNMLSLARQIFLYSTLSLLEVPPHINESTLMKLESRYLVRIIYGTWILALVVIINVYKGLFTSFVLAPLQPTHSWNHLSQLENFFVWNSHFGVVDALGEMHALTFDPILCECINKIGITPHFQPIYHYKRGPCTYFPPYEKALSQHMKMEPDYYAMHFNNCAEYSEISIDEWAHLKPSNTTDKFLKYRQRLLPKNGLIFRARDIRSPLEGFITPEQRSFKEYLPILMMCDKTAFIDNEMNVKAFVTEAQYGSLVSKNGERFTDFSTGDVGFLPLWTGWKLKTSEVESYPLHRNRQNIYLQLQYLHQHGIIQIWDNWYSKLVSPIPDLEKKRSAIKAFQRQPHKLTRDLNVASMFLIWGVCLGLCVIGFIGEFIHSYIMILLELYYFLRTFHRA